MFPLNQAIGSPAMALLFCTFIVSIQTIDVSGKLGQRGTYLKIEKGDNNNNNNNNNSNISLFREDNILSIAYLTYGPLQVKTIQLFTNKLYTNRLKAKCSSLGIT